LEAESQSHGPAVLGVREIQRNPEPSDERDGFLEALMTRAAISATTVALICATFYSTSYCHADPLTKDDEYHRRQKHDEVYRFNVNDLIAATLAKSKDLARKGRNTYFCEYSSSSAVLKACDRMDTISGQYEDYYQSQMACAQRCPWSDITQSSWSYIAGTKRICRDLATGSCEKVALTLKQAREELINLLRLEETMNHGPLSSQADQTLPHRSGEQ